MSKPIWIVRDYLKCTGCRRYEIECSLHHGGWIRPEASRVRVFMPFPGVEVLHLCAQCDDYPCVVRAAKMIEERSLTSAVGSNYLVIISYTNRTDKSSIAFSLSLVIVRVIESILQ